MAKRRNVEGGGEKIRLGGERGAWSEGSVERGERGSKDRRRGNARDGDWPTTREGTGSGRPPEVVHPLVR